MLEHFHDQATGDLVLAWSLVLGVLALLVMRWTRPRASTIGVAVGMTAFVTLAMLFVRSTGFSGDLLRTRWGFPHFALVTNLDPMTLASTFDVNVGYLVLDAMFWLPLALIGASIMARRGEHAPSHIAPEP
jgi:hypothetical protein